MTGENSRSVLPALSATVLVTVALYFASDIFAPVAMSLFVIAILWPLQKALETAIPRFFALLQTLAATVVVLGTFGLLTAGAITLVGLANRQYQPLLCLVWPDDGLVRRPWHFAG